MHIHSVVLSLTALLGTTTATNGVGFGSTWGLWPPPPSQGGPTIMKMTTTLTVPALTDPLKSALILWPGIYTQGGVKGQALIQTIAAEYVSPQGVAGCGSVPPGKWISRASTYEVRTNHQDVGPCVGVTKGDKLHMTYTYDPSHGSYHQTLLVNGKEASSLSSPGFGPGYRFYIDVECQGNWRGDSMTHVYSNTTITLNKVYKQYPNYIRKKASAAVGFSSPDGKVWHAEKITLERAPCTPAP